MGKDGVLVSVMGVGAPGTSAQWFGEGLKCARLAGSLIVGDPGRLLVGEPGCEWPPFGFGCSVKRNSRPGICQNIWRDTNIRDHPSLSSMTTPTAESRVEISPIRSSFGIRFLPLRTPSRFMLILHSPRGLPDSGVFFDASL